MKSKVDAYLDDCKEELRFREKDWNSSLARYNLTSFFPICYFSRALRCRTRSKLVYIFFPWNQILIHHFWLLKRVSEIAVKRSKFFFGTVKKVFFQSRALCVNVAYTLIYLDTFLKLIYHFRSLKKVSEIAVRRSKFFSGTVNTPISSHCATPSRTHSMSIWWPNWWKAASSSTRSSSKSFFPKKKPDVSWRWSPQSSNPYTLTGWVFLLFLVLSQDYCRM